jgi:hypothetical protein
MEPIGGSEPTPQAPSAPPAPFVMVAMVFVAVVTLAATLAIVAIVATTRDHDGLPAGLDATPSGPTRYDHWHAALGVNDCGRWVPNWPWPPGASLSTGGPARAGSNGNLYAGLHSHGDGLIHIEPLASDEMGNNATLGLYFRYGGWKLGTKDVTFVGVDERNGNLCNGRPGVLRWAVNGTERHGDPSAYKIADGDVIELVFTTADASLPSPTEVPSYPELREMLGLGLPA